MSLPIDGCVYTVAINTAFLSCRTPPPVCGRGGRPNSACQRRALWAGAVGNIPNGAGALLHATRRPSADMIMILAGRWTGAQNTPPMSAITEAYGQP